MASPAAFRLAAAFAVCTAADGAPSLDRFDAVVGLLVAPTVPALVH